MLPCANSSASARSAGFASSSLTLRSEGNAAAAAQVAFALRSSQQIQLRVEAFNIFNQERFGQPNGTLGSPTFGQITSADDGRIVQLGFKFIF